MAKVKIQGHASGSGVITVTAPNTSTDRTVTLPDATATIATTTDVAARLPSITDNGNATAMTIDSNEGVGIKNTNSDSFLYKGLVVGDGGASDQGINIYSAAWGALTFADATSGTGRYEGSIAYNHAENRMAIATNHATAMNIDSTGAVTMPSQPAFMAQAGPNDQNDMAKDAWTGVRFINERFDQNSDYASNTFTAPITGKYQLNLIMRIDNLDTAATYYQVRLNTSNRAYNCIKDFGGMSADPAYFNFTLTVLADMDANDTVSVDFLQSGGAVQTDITDVSFFSGYLAC